MRTPTAFIFGALAATLIAAAAFRGGGQPVDSTFTYQGQLRNAGQLVNGSVDVRFTLWDSDVGGTQIGNTNSFTNYPLTDGRFALGLNFGNGAFNGDQRWVQVEFRSPAGVGQYLTLNPRDKIMATPYALYALNGTASQWDYNPKTQSLTAAANVSKVGIGTSTPTAALEVVSATGGDDAVKLPAGSIGAAELSAGLGAVASFSPALSPAIPSATRQFSTAQPGFVLVSGIVRGGYLCCGSDLIRHEVLLNGVVIWTNTTRQDGANPPLENSVLRLVAIPQGRHEIQLRITGFNSFQPWIADDDLCIQFFPNLLFAE
jgi:hypothetical protein